jgi:uncharacterized DUF497 family protein
LDFDFDPNRSASNRVKHGIDFIQVQELWDDPNLIEIPSRVTDEARFLVIGRIAEKHWAGVITDRDDRIRIISVRRSRQEEIDLYEG